MHDILKSAFFILFALQISAYTGVDFSYYSILKYSRNRGKSFAYLGIVRYFALYLFIGAYVKDC